MDNPAAEASIPAAPTAAATPPPPAPAPSAPVLSGATIVQAHKLIKAGWLPVEGGMWINEQLDSPVSAETACAVVSILAKIAPTKAATAVEAAEGAVKSVWEHFATSTAGILSMSSLSAIAAYVAANPPDDVLPPGALKFVKYGFGLLVVVVGGNQLVKSRAAVQVQQQTPAQGGASSAQGVAP